MILVAPCCNEGGPGHPRHQGLRAWPAGAMACGTSIITIPSVRAAMSVVAHNRVASRQQYDAAVAEYLGAINYAAAGVQQSKDAAWRKTV